MRRQDFHFELPESLIAQRPSEVRGESRLCHLHSDGSVEFGAFAQVIDQFKGDELLVLNDTKVVPARVYGHKASGGAVEMLFVEPLENGRILAMLRGGHLKPGSRLVFPGAEAELCSRREDGTAELLLSRADDLWTWLDEVGEMPLPPYIEREADESDKERYQTVFARESGAVAAPTAGLHFTPELLDALRAKGVEIRTITLHVGPGTFRPVKVDNIDEHRMHSERYTVPEETRAALASGKPIVAVGTTVVRTLESYALDPAATRTDIFIKPGFEFRLVDGLITNFHLPESTLLMLVCAFSGQEKVLNAYNAAVREGLHFFSYGDAMLMHREGGRWI